MWFLIILLILAIITVFAFAKASGNASRAEEYMRIKNNIKDE